MLLNINRTKYLTVFLVMLLCITSFSSFTMGAESSQPQVSQAGPATSAEPMNQQHYSDVPDTAWYAEAVNTWIQQGILNPKEDEKLNPQLVMTRGEFAKYLAISVGLSPSKSTSPFKDMSVDDVSNGYVIALHDEGLAKGYLDGTFRPNANITRAEAASLIVSAKKLNPEPQVGSGFHDVPQKSWYAGAVGALTKAGIATGKSKENFDPNTSIILAEGITFLYRSFFTPSIIQDIEDDGTITINGYSYKAGLSVQGIFNSSNKAALHNAAIQFTFVGDTITSVEGLIIGYKDALAGTNAPIIFDAQGNTINGTVIVSSNEVAIAHVEVKGNLNLSPAVQSDFFAFNVLVHGKTIFIEDSGRPTSQITNIWFKHSDLGEIILNNSALLKKVDINTDKPTQLSSQLRFKSKEVASMLAFSIEREIQELYIGYFNRPADVAGLEFWEGAVEIANGNTDVIADSFVGSMEYQDILGIQTTTLIVNSIYLNVFGRGPDIEEHGFWIAGLNAGGISIGEIDQQISEAASNPGTGNSETVDSSVAVQLSNITGTFQASVDTDLSTDTSTNLDTVTVDSGNGILFTGTNAIAELIIGNRDMGSTIRGSSSTSFSGLVDISQVSIHDSAGAVNLNVQGTIDKLTVTGESPQIDLGASTAILDLIVSSGLDPTTVFANNDDLSRVRAINGQSTAPTPTRNPTPSPSPSPSPSPNPNPNGNPNSNPSMGI